MAGVHHVFVETQRETNGKSLTVSSLTVSCLTLIYASLMTTMQGIKPVWKRTISTTEDARVYKTRVSQSMH